MRTVCVTRPYRSDSVTTSKVYGATSLTETSRILSVRRPGALLGIWLVLMFAGSLLSRSHAGRQHDLSGADIELPVMEVALDHITFDIAFRQRAGPVGAKIVEHVELAVDVEDRDAQAFLLDLEGGADRDLVGAAEFDLHGA